MTLLVSGLLLGTSTVLADNRDPLEPVNRVIFSINNGVDRVLVRPVARTYHWVIPDPMEQGVRNVFANLGEVRNASNNLLQGKWRRTGAATGRFAINTTVGLVGVFDVASRMGIEPVPEDFGQTLGYWGLGHGFYLVLPILGPSSLRDGTGRVVDQWQNPLNYVEMEHWQRGSILVVDGLQTRADLLASDGLFSGDTYPVIREAYFSMREFQVNDGEVKSDAFIDEDSAEEGFVDEGFIDESF
ncbi:MlaA family lipoprotein [Saccharospirillum mangrovi]|uniref:MlaA family lipoprotein n=1 Tax=Saccharospirillum mangrovi TaxID=2161747 RepID=UPI000D3B6F4E|nr:VacJ family lipoprotein [Saccharospirillum mangrovi]